MKKLNVLTLSALAIASAVVAGNRFFVNPSPFFGESETVTTTKYLASTNGADSIASTIVTRSDVEVSFQNDETYPWTISGATVKNGNCGIRYSTSTLTMNYKSDRKTELSFDWRCYNYSSHSPLTIFVDGVQKGTISNSSYASRRFYIDPGQHTIVFKDSIGNSTSTSNYSNIKNVQIREIQPLETAVLTEKSKPLTFVNDDVWPWTIEGGYIQNSNYGTANSTSKFSTTFTIDKLSKFSFEHRVGRLDGNYWYSYNDQYFCFLINGKQYYSCNYATSWGAINVALEPGEYTVEWTDSIYNNNVMALTRIRNVELSDDWVEVDLSSAGSLGTEVLNLVDVLTDVELLKVKGTINAADWTTIKQMTNLLAIDLSEAKFNAVPNNAFDGLSRLSNVKLPEGMTSIGDYAFRGTQLLNIDIPNSVTSIGKYAFYEVRVETVNFGSASKLQSIGERAFYGCTNLRKLHIPDAVTTMAEYVCYNCSTLVDLKLPNNLTTIKTCAFERTSKLKSIKFPDVLNEIGNYAFRYSGMDSVCIPLKLSVLGYGAFWDCRDLKYVELPSYIESYNDNFGGCTSLETVVCKSATPPSVSYDPFSGTTTAKSKMTLIVPSFAIADYKLDTYWYQFGNIVESEEDADYWKITGPLSLTNNRRMNGKPDVDLYYGGKFTVSGDAPMEIGKFNIYMSETNPGLLLNTCEAMTADDVTTRFSVNSNRWYFFTPLHDVDLTKVSVSNGASYVFRYYDGNNRAMNGTGNNWKDVDNGKLYAGQGYIFQCNANAVITMPAGTAGHAQVFNAGDAKKALAANVSISSANKGWNYVGNPYPTYYDIYYMDFTAPITVWTGSTYKAYSIVDDDYVLRPMQAFFVQKPDGVDNIVFQKAGCQLSSSVDRAAYARPAQTPSHASSRQLFDVKIADDELADEMRVVVNEGASLSYEIECDASKFMSFESSVPQIFTLDADGNGHAINERPFADGRIQVAYYAGKSGYLTISATRADGDIFLYDGILNKTVNLAEQDYTFYSDVTAGVDNTRFVMFLSAENNGTTGIDAVGNESKMNDNDIYDLQGRKVEDTSIKGIYIQNGKKIVK